ncbi:hypothetical protein ACLPAF_02465 [Proteus mirabilis]
MVQCAARQGGERCQPSEAGTVSGRVAAQRHELAGHRRHWHDVPDTQD